jgi:hypothetical protein
LYLRCKSCKKYMASSADCLSRTRKSETSSINRAAGMPFLLVSSTVGSESRSASDITEKRCSTLERNTALLENLNQRASGGGMNRMQRIATARMCMHVVSRDAQKRGSSVRAVRFCRTLAAALASSASAADSTTSTSAPSLWCCTPRNQFRL